MKSVTKFTASLLLYLVATTSASAQMASTPKVKGNYLNQELWEESVKASKGSGEAFELPTSVDPNLPNVLLMGTSISIGYTLPVREDLNGEANVYRIPGNGGSTERAMTDIALWLSDMKWDIIHINFGLHDLKYLKSDEQRDVPPAQYQSNLRNLFTYIQQHSSAKIIWASTTFVPSDVKPRRDQGDDKLYNDLALEVLKEFPEIIFDDHYKLTTENPELQRAHNVHFTDQGYERIGGQVSSHIRKLLPQYSPNPKSLPRADLSSRSESILTRFVPSKGVTKGVEYDPLVGHDGDCESALPYSVSASGTLSLSNERFIGGKSSLRWDYTSDDVMSFNFEEGKSLSRPDYEIRGGGAAFLYMWIYNTRAIKEKDLYVKIYDDKGALAFEFPIYVDFEGWRCLIVAYDEMKPQYRETQISRMEFYAPSNEEGVLYFDAISPTIAISGSFVNRDYLTPWRADGTNHWGLQWKWDSLSTRMPQTPESISEEVKSDLDTIYNRVTEEIFATPLSKKWDPTVVAKLAAKYDKYEINITNDGLITSLMILLDEDYFELMAAIADSYMIAPEGSAEREALKGMYINMARNMVDQGFAKGHGMGYYLHYGYRCSTIAPSMFKMKAELKEANLYRPMEEAIIWLYGLNRIFDRRENLKKGNADDFSTLYRVYLELVQIIDNEPRRSVYMQALSDYYNYAIDWRNGSALKEHGAHYHHDVHYANYASRGLAALGEIGVKLRGTRYHFSQEAHETLRNCALAGLHSSYPYKDRSLWAMGMVGRHSEQSPIAGYEATLFSNLALMGTPDGTQPIDSEMASIYTYNFPNAKEVELGEGIKPIDFEGTWTLPHGRNMTHRRDDWSAMVVSYSNNGHRNIEAFGDDATKGANLSGLMQAFGRFELYYHERSIAENGYVKDGFNWSHRDGITTPDIPANENRMAPRHYSDIEANFANGAVREGVGGVYGTILDNNANGAKALFPGVFTAKKSWFFLDDMIVALGSDISYEYREMRHVMPHLGDIKEYPVVTTLFQKRIASQGVSGTHNGAKIARGIEQIISNGRDYFIDPIGTGYIIYGGGELEIMNQDQSNYAPDDTRMKKPLNGEYATVLINHGKEPQNASYEYCIIPAASESQLKKMSKKRGYKVVQQDDTAHIIEYGAARYHTIFSNYEGASSDLLQSVESPALIIVEQNRDKSITLSVASPSYNITEPIILTLAGEWKAEHQQLLNIEHQGGSTTLAIDPHDGVTTNITLTK